MKRIEYYKIGFLMLIPVLVFFPLFTSVYYYTDEVLQLWLYRKGSSFDMFVPQGRLLNDRLFRYMYSNINTIPDLRRLRLFSLAGWLVVIPLWYGIIDRVTRDEGMHRHLAFFSVLFLVTSLPFSISIQWAACMELFIANTGGLLAGYLVYRYDRRGWFPAIILGLVSLFFYQNGFGCFLLPFFLQVVARQKADGKMLEPLLLYLAIYGIYFLLFKGMMKMVLHASVTDRAALLTNPFEKAYYFFAKVLPQAFYFNKVLNERSMTGRIVFGLVAGVCLWFNYLRLQRRMADFGRYALLIFGGSVLIYLPSLLIHENYASNRTLLGLDLAVFVWVFSTLVQSILQPRWQPAILTGIGLILFFISLYNFRYIFLRPAAGEYQELKEFIDRNYNPSITSIDYIRSPEDEVRSKYGIQSSWDEYGFSSSYFAWVPDAATRQLVFERTGDRELANKLIIRVWVDRQAWQASHPQSIAGSLLVDAPAILRNEN